jgi:dipeptidyl aminopeptidase/acylaminoacyl peptidase
MIRKRIFISLALVIGISITAYFLIKLGSGYRLDFTNKSLRPTGLLVANSLPNQATIFINGKANKNKTATTLNLAPGKYQVEIKKDGFSSWQKELLIEKELVVKTDAYLFPTYPELKPLTSTGAANPLISPDKKKAVFAVDSEDEKAGLWVLDLSERALGLKREPRQIVQSAPKGRNFAQGEYQWSLDSKQILITLAGETILEENFLLDASILNEDTKLIDITEQKEALLKRWDDEREIIRQDKISRLPEELIQILEETTKNITFSSDETKILYTATASASIPQELIPALPGASTQTEQRDLEPDKTYVYDLKEDRNFAINLPEEAEVSWFPTSKHLLIIQKDKISIIEYDNTNLVDVYSGPFENSFAFSFPSGNRLLILTSLSKETPQNLYAITLR